MTPSRLATLVRATVTENLGWLDSYSNPKWLDGVCGPASVTLRDMFLAYGHQADFIEGYFKRSKDSMEPHCWVETPESIWDVTATQFGDFPSVYRTSRKDPQYRQKIRNSRVSLVHWRKPRLITSVETKLGRWYTEARHVGLLIHRHKIKVQYRRQGAGAAWGRDYVVISPIEGPRTYARAMHELGHCLHTDESARLYGEQADEEAAWTWARLHAIRWTPAMQAYRDECLRTYQEKR